MMKRLGCLTGSGLISAIVTLVIMTGFVLAQGYELFSPGPLSSQAGVPLGGVGSHAEIGGECKLCHTAPWETATMADRCVKCHADVAIQFQDPSTLHGSLHGNNTELTCRTCHPEHNGATSPITVLKGLNFPHDNFGFSLKSHKGNFLIGTPDCADCHTKDFNFSDPVNCETCHREIDMAFVDSHTLIYGSACQDCHDGLETIGKNFDHAKVTFPIGGKHAKVTCSNCHMGQHSLGDLQATSQVCSDCHLKDDAHSGSLGLNCATCHNVEGWKPAVFDHNVTNFKLDGEHREVACESCHQNGDFLSTPKDCVGCHAPDDEHEGRFGTTCEDCHTIEGWKPAKFDHNLASYKLDGEHLSVACESCHLNGEYKGTPADCFTCHAKADVHKGSLGTNCSECHTSFGWLLATFDHSQSTFKLTGKHLNVVCQSCHANKIYKDAPTDCYSCHVSIDKHKGSFGVNCASCHSTSTWTGATFDHSQAAFKLSGKHVSTACQSCHVNGVFKGTPTTCYACHSSRDKHNGSFGVNCASCHSTSTWAGATFDHSQAAFKLTGKHVSTACQSCHVNGVFKGTPTTCYACHSSRDKHNGSFGVNCASCHSTSTWTGATFDHSQAAFKLTGKHVSTACQSCHVNGVYKGTPTTCYACHSSNDKHNGSNGTNCASCHSTSTWSGAVFDHSQASFKLTGAHLSVSCSKCHINNVYKGTASACSACHSEPSFHAGVFGTDCAKCHSTSNWSASYTGPHPNIDGKNGIYHKGASCKDCHTQNLSSATCLKCHDSNNPKD
jgi:hypothetical protein